MHQAKRQGHMASPHAVRHTCCYVADTHGNACGARHGGMPCGLRAWQCMVRPIADRVAAVVCVVSRGVWCGGLPRIFLQNFILPSQRKFEPNFEPKITV